MLKSIELHNLGPSQHMKVDFMPRLNLLTGDNGLGKTFIPDIAWWALARKWADLQALPDPDNSAQPTISFLQYDAAHTSPLESRFSFEKQTWPLPVKRLRTRWLFFLTRMFLHGLLPKFSGWGLPVPWKRKKPFRRHWRQSTGLTWIHRHSERFMNGWRCLNELYSLYNGICAYACVLIPPVTGGRSVEHFAPKMKHPDYAYEWKNYRLVCSLMNSRKRDFEDVLDPSCLG